MDGTTLSREEWQARLKGMDFLPPQYKERPGDFVIKEVKLESDDMGLYPYEYRILGFPDWDGGRVWFPQKEPRMVLPGARMEERYANSIEIPDEYDSQFKRRFPRQWQEEDPTMEQMRRIREYGERFGLPAIVAVHAVMNRPEMPLRVEDAQQEFGCAVYAVNGAEAGYGKSLLTAVMAYRWGVPFVDADHFSGWTAQRYYNLFVEAGLERNRDVAELAEYAIEQRARQPRPKPEGSQRAVDVLDSLAQMYEGQNRPPLVLCAMPGWKANAPRATNAFDRIQDGMTDVFYIEKQLKNGPDYAEAVGDAERLLGDTMYLYERGTVEEGWWRAMRRKYWMSEYYQMERAGAGEVK